MQPALFDTSVYISALRRYPAAVLGVRRDGPLWLSAVVLEELYAGANEQAHRSVERLQHNFEQAGRIVVPNLKDWSDAGYVLARLAAKYDYEQIGQERLTNDALIAVSAGRQGIRIITMNNREFTRLAEFRKFQWELASTR